MFNFVSLRNEIKNKVLFSEEKELKRLPVTPDPEEKNKTKKSMSISFIIPKKFRRN